ncbi:MAG: 2-phospho-L-lactate guanylyltransferase [Sinobacteraceae bacterium]|nr:2-phospho-L-lactate guanylyltransferase [Nevskiaceae bacterium]
MQLERPSDAICVLIAIKARARCKQRLAPILTPEARLQLARSMLAQVIAAGRAARAVQQVIVVSPERDDVPSDIPVFADTGDNLNSALQDARRMLLRLGCRQTVILPADLPQICASDIDTLIRQGRTGCCALVSDAAGRGTNALYLDTAEEFTFCFGLESRQRHLQEAARRRLTPQLVRLPGLEFDVDCPADLQRLEAAPWLAIRA